MELTGLGYDQGLQETLRRSSTLRRASEIPLTLERTLTTGGEPNPSAPRTPNPEEEPEERKELAPPGILSLEAIFLLAPFSIFGLLARLGIAALARYPNDAIFELAWVQAAGCLVMGIAQSQKAFIMTFYPPLYLGITTGFCGSLTTFASWQRDVFLAWIEGRPAGFSNWHRFLDGATRLFFTQAISVATFKCGLAIGKRRVHIMPQIPHRPLRVVITVVALCTYIAVFPLFFVLPLSFREEVTAALLFAFPGALTRHLLGTWLNAKKSNFPLGTFASNTAGTVISAIVYVLQHTHPVECNSSATAILQGLTDGYAGCLSTVSTFVAEAYLMNRKDSWTYVLWSWISAQILLVLVLGIPYWTMNLDRPFSC
ncbi:SubName: Full=Uncharacterized protein {ECO:0000313/EMBL:CCA66575.1} [Serendipita indica DSM 11827]|uniref:CrcB-like protein-domain-containing protein n=1 Tax=Serendipita indica (strain DSM 11827) TaxID=1109443 RepID=G4T5L1_SERID|nr:SubName: Full=Uncharacterized protein {ECO:0000313/EMBL:CCA66575.1} [Serendipita indica DSM 11827]CCA66575.1 hypothetical protein PIIN_00258 [Serendipita indica DSM 11827]